METLIGRTAVMTGASGWEGAGVVRALLNGGMNVAVVTHMRSQADQLAESVKNLPGKCIVIEDSSWDDICQFVYDTFGSIDVVIPNQGAPISRKTMEETNDSFFNEKLHHQIVSSFDIVKASLPYLRKSRAPRIILMSSAGGQIGSSEEFVADGTARGGVIAMTYSMAREFAHEGITVNCIARAGIKKETYKKGSNAIPLERYGTPDEFGAAVAYLASEEAGFVTGQIINLSGGLTIGC